jgi:hypothetical protein
MFVGRDLKSCVEEMTNTFIKAIGVLRSLTHGRPGGDEAIDANTRAIIYMFYGSPGCQCVLMTSHERSDFLETLKDSQ